MSREPELAALAESLRGQLDDAHAAREVSLSACRATIRACSNAIRAVHRRDTDQASDLADEAAAHLRRAQDALRPHPRLAGSGPLHDAEKEYAEARLTACLVSGQPLPSNTDLEVSGAAWLCGLAEAASELRRHLLDRLRDGDLSHGESLLQAMDDAYGMLIAIDYPDAVTGGLRRNTDALRAVLERTRGDLTTTVLQHRLQESIESRTPPSPSGA